MIASLKFFMVIEHGNILTDPLLTDGVRIVHWTYIIQVPTSLLIVSPSEDDYSNEKLTKFPYNLLHEHHN